jgi:hypothetical protein
LFVSGADMLYLANRSNISSASSSKLPGLGPWKTPTGFRPPAQGCEE